MKRFADEFKKEMNSIAPTPEQCERIRSGVYKKMARPSARRVLIPATAFTGACAAVFCGVIFISGLFGATSSSPKNNMAAQPQTSSDYASPAVNNADGLSHESAAAGADIKNTAPDNDAPAMPEDVTGGTTVDATEDKAYDDFAGEAVYDGADENTYIEDNADNGGDEGFLTSETLCFSNDGNNLEYNGKSYIITDKAAPNTDTGNLDEVYDDSGNKFLILIDGGELTIYDADGIFMAVYHVN